MTLYVVVAFLSLAAVVINLTVGRELRPSDHGLAYQENSFPPVQNDDAREMRSFFGTTTSVPLPEAKNISDVTWWNHGGSRDVRRNHVRVGLLLASAVCGLTGVVLLSVAGIVFLFRLHKQKLLTSSTSAAAAAAAVTDKL